MVTRLNRDDLEAIAERAPVVSVVGDLLLDGWWSGAAERITREAPVPAVDISDRVRSAGGAANTAVNLAALGARVRLTGWVGDDVDGRALVALLADAGVDTAGVLLLPGRTTTTKTRVVVDEQVLMRLDDVGEDSLGSDDLDALLAAALEARRGAAAEVVCDYGGSFLAHLREALASAGGRPPLVVVDAHDLAPWRILRPDLITPNAREAAALVGSAGPSPAGADEDRVAWVQAHAGALAEASGAAAVVVTLDRTGSVLLTSTEAGAGEAGARETDPGEPGPDREPVISHRTWARPGRESNASGAGDSFVAGLTVARASGFALETSLDLAQLAADVVVRRFGTSVCSTADVIDALHEREDAAWDLDELVRRLDEERARGKRIVLTNGCFDVLHRGHTTSLAEARALGDVLVVAVNDDASTRRLKGPTRPINPVQDRVGVVSALSCVDYVTAFGADTAVAIIERLRPDVYAKGGDYVPEMMDETEAVRRIGGHVAILDYVKDHSTTLVVDRIRSSLASTSADAQEQDDAAEALP
ncbi:bifunctional D-glycero-beta-D-manno-heptose-7-phosphate kinase/D-glycero-beta-D-manno-heptose 1-phosphate adenylyltransferase HldE [Frondihabitans peucedani]|uniref:Bifunctional D-glycero-beta-D-manno-heptose-7-phosphate kinase/D-glycero-beta-D-manno-heptose 1-phosphate adenylyltransferase HldE n=1 Tax=Frondihabitans peucedani TaxID=598626 RepID=A0ABP8E6A8_9MICO